MHATIHATMQDNHANFHATMQIFKQGCNIFMQRNHAKMQLFIQDAIFSRPKMYLFRIAHFSSKNSFWHFHQKTRCLKIIYPPKILIENAFFGFRPLILRKKTHFSNHIFRAEFQFIFHFTTAPQCGHFWLNLGLPG